MGITSIWANEFFNNKKPIPKWCFEVNFVGLENSDVKSNIKKDALLRLNHAIESISFGRRETSIVKTYYCGVEANLPGRVMNTGELNIVFNENDKLEVTSLLEAIFADSCSDDRYFVNSTKYGYTPHTKWRKSSKVIVVKIIKPDSIGVISDENTNATVLASYKFYGCILTSVNEEEFSYANTDDILKRTARFSYDYMIKSNDYSEWYKVSDVKQEIGEEEEEMMEETGDFKFDGEE